MFSSIPSDATSSQAEKNWYPQGYYVESPKNSNADTNRARPSLSEPDDEFLNPRNSSSAILLSSRPSSATYSFELSSVWRRNGSSRRPLRTLSKIAEDSSEKEQSFLNVSGLWMCFFYVLCTIATVSIIVWLILHPHPPKLNIQDLRFLKINVFSGTDRTDVPTYLISIDSMFNISIMKHSKYNKMDLHHSEFTLYYNEVPLAKTQVYGALKQESNSIVAHVSLRCSESPLYGAGYMLQGAIAEKGSAEFLLRGTIHTKFRMIKGIWKKHFSQDIKCNSVVNLLKLQVIHMDCNTIFERRK